LIGRDARQRPVMDSVILIRTAEIERDGGLTVGVGATIVRHSDPLAEAAETRAKAAGLLRALEDGPAPLARRPGTPELAAASRIGKALAARNDTLARFWLADDAEPAGPRLPGDRRVLVIDAEDAFTAMLAHQVGAMGATVTVRRYDEPF